MLVTYVYIPYDLEFKDLLSPSEKILFPSYNNVEILNEVHELFQQIKNNVVTPLDPAFYDIIEVLVEILQKYKLALHDSQIDFESKWNDRTSDYELIINLGCNDEFKEKIEKASEVIRRIKDEICFYR